MFLNLTNLYLIRRTQDTIRVAALLLCKRISTLRGGSSSGRGKDTLSIAKHAVTCALKLCPTCLLLSRGIT